MSPCLHELMSTKTSQQSQPHAQPAMPANDSRVRMPRGWMYGFTIVAAPAAPQLKCSLTFNDQADVWLMVALGGLVLWRRRCLSTQVSANCQ